MKYIWDPDDDYIPENMIGEYIDDQSPDRFELKAGTRLSNDWGVPKFSFPTTKSEMYRYDELSNNALVPLVSPRVAEMLKSCAGDLVQLIPTELRAKDGIVTDYVLVNATALGDVIDRSASEYNCIPGTDHPMGFLKMVLLDQPDDRMILRDGFSSGYLFVSPEFKALAEDCGWKGVGMFRAEDMR